MRTVWLASAVAALLGCGGSTDGGAPGGGAAGPPCKLTVSGATAGSYPCTTRSASWSDTTDLGSVMIGYGATGQTIPVIGVSFTFAGLPYAGTFTDADSDGGVSARIMVTTGAATWAATDGTSAPATGTYTLVLTNLTATKVLPDGEVYAANGMLAATLPPVPRTSAAENVTLHASF